jgi:hypothetical protein
MNEPADGKHVVIVDGQRVTGPLTEAEANAEAEKRRRAINERAGDPAHKPKVQVMRNLFG